MPYASEILFNVGLGNGLLAVKHQTIIWINVA